MWQFFWNTLLGQSRWGGRGKNRTIGSKGLSDKKSEVVDILYLSHSKRKIVTSVMYEILMGKYLIHRGHGLVILWILCRFINAKIGSLQKESLGIQRENYS